MAEHGLSPQHVATLRAILAPYAQQIECAGLFGSRATGKYRADSDIDLVLYGRLDAVLCDRLRSAFEASYLPVTVDVQAYDLITYPPFKAHIDAVMRPLFTRADLLQTPA